MDAVVLETIRFKGTNEYQYQYMDEHKYNREVSLLDTFYKAHYRKIASAKPGDRQYSLRKASGGFHPLSDGDGTMVATLRLCRPNNHGWTFLRSLCVAKQYRRQGLAKKLLHLVLEEYLCRYAAQHNRDDDAYATATPAGVYCFAEDHLAPLYLQCGFQKSSTGLPMETIHQFEKLKRRLGTANNTSGGNYNTLECFQRTIPPMSPPIKILLVQHEKEVSRKTGTAKLLYGLPTHHVKVQNQTWSGRVDNQILEQRFLQNNSHYDGPFVLLWTGGSSSNNASHYHHSHFTKNSTTSQHAVTFVLLDGTWQEAQTMFRKIPALHNLPRLSLQTTYPSNFTMRQDFGWKNRFEANSTMIKLLCTAEVCAELMDQVAGNAEGSMLLKKRLERFQDKKMGY